MSYDCVVIGAGLAGSGVAAALARAGWRVLLCERRVGSHHKVCGEFLSPETQHSLRALGVYESIAALRPTPLTAARFVSRNGVSLNMPLPGEAWGISRYKLDAALADAAAHHGALLRTGSTVTAVACDGDGYTVTLRDAGGAHTSVQTRAVVSACGRHPLPGLRSKAESGPARQPLVGVKCHWRGLHIPPEVQIYLFKGGYAGLSAIEDGRSNLCMLVTREAFSQAGSTVRGMVVAAAQANPLLARVLAAGELLPETACAVAPVDTERVPRPWERFPRVGDAVAMIPPLCGDGMAMALRSAVLCYRSADAFLRGESSRAQWEATYCAAWHHEFAQRLFVGRQLQRALGVPLLNDALLLAGHVAPFAAQALLRATRGAA